MQEEFEVEIRWRAFPLHPDTPPEGRSLDDLFAGMAVDVSAMVARLQKVAADLGLPFGQRSMTFNSRAAQELGKWAEARGRGHAFHMAVFQAYFAEGLNIAQAQILEDIGASLGFARDEVRKALETRPFREEVDRDWSRAGRLGITAIPCLHIDDQNLAGAQPYEQMAKLLDFCGVPRKNTGRNGSRR